MDQKEQLKPCAFTAAATFAAKGEAGGPRKFSATAYSGGVITDHPWHERVAFDLASTKFDTPAPALYRHDAPVGVIKAAVISNTIQIDGELFADLEGDAKNIAEMADRGLPWQMSVGIWPGEVSMVKAGTKVKLNGQSFEGPLTVFRNNRVRETSFCALGADDKTRAHIFSIGGESAHQQRNRMETVTKEEHDRIIAELNAKFDTEKKTLTDKVADLEGRFTATQRAQRKAEVKTLFEASGREFKDELATPYLDMTPEQFAAVGEVFKSQKPALDPKLGQEQAKGTGGTGDAAAPNTVDAIRAAASAYIADQAKLGFSVSVADAVAHVKQKAAA